MLYQSQQKRGRDIEFEKVLTGARPTLLEDYEDKDVRSAWRGTSSLRPWSIYLDDDNHISYVDYGKML